MVWGGILILVARLFGSLAGLIFFAFGLLSEASANKMPGFTVEILIATIVVYLYKERGKKKNSPL